MNSVLWVVQLLLAAAFLAPRLALSLAPAGRRRADERVAAALVLALPRRSGGAGCGGLTLPGLTRILPWLVTWAAAGVMIVTISATAYHVMRGEFSSAAITLMLFAMATFLAYMRRRVLPIVGRRAT